MINYFGGFIYIEFGLLSVKFYFYLYYGVRFNV